MSISLSSQEHQNPYTQERKEESYQTSPNNTAIQIQNYFNEKKEIMSSDFIDLYQNILNRYEWSLKSGESLTPTIKIALGFFANQKLDYIDALIDWSNFEPETMGSFDQNGSDQRLIEQQTIEHCFIGIIQSFDSGFPINDDKLKEFITTLVNSFPFLGEVSEKINPLIRYLNQTGYKQLPLVVSTALSIRGGYAEEFIKAVISDEIVFEYRDLVAFPPQDISSSSNRLPAQTTQLDFEYEGQKYSIRKTCQDGASLLHAILDESIYEEGSQEKGDSEQNSSSTVRQLFIGKLEEELGKENEIIKDKFVIMIKGLMNLEDSLSSQMIFHEKNFKNKFLEQVSRKTSRLEQEIENAKSEVERLQQTVRLSSGAPNVAWEKKQIKTLKERQRAKKNELENIEKQFILEKCKDRFTQAFNVKDYIVGAHEIDLVAHLFNKKVLVLHDSEEGGVSNLINEQCTGELVVIRRNSLNYYDRCKIIREPPLSQSKKETLHSLVANPIRPLPLDIEQALKSVLLAKSHDFNNFFEDTLFHLLVAKETQLFIKEIFLGLDQGFLGHRSESLLQRMIKEQDECLPQRIHHFLQIILSNSRLLNYFNSEATASNRKTAARNEKLFEHMHHIYGWGILPISMKERVCENVFNPLFHQHLDKFLCLPKNEHGIQKLILDSFLNLIQCKGQDLINESKIGERAFKDVSQLIKMLLANFKCQEMHEGQPLEYLLYVFQFLKDRLGIRGKTEKKLEIAKKILDTCLEVKLEHIGKLTYEKKINRLAIIIENSFQETQTIEKLEECAHLFEKSFEHRLFAELYSDDEFKEWLINENPEIQIEEMGPILNRMASTRAFLEGNYETQLSKKGFNTVHNNQIGALAVLETCIKEKNVFLKLGTGQGKSLIAEMAAIHLLNSPHPPQRVFIFTSYDHLAKRDHERMEFLSEGTAHPSIYISSKTSFITQREKIKAAKIIHTDSHEFEIFLANFFQKAMEEQEDVSDLLPIFFNQEESGAILDEGDLLTLDDEKRGFVVNFPNTFGSQSIDMSNEGQRRHFDEKIGELAISKLEHYFPGVYDAWYTSKAEDNSEGGKVTNPASRKTTHNASSFSNKISKGIYQFEPLFCNFSSFVRSFRDVLFLSGSITKKNMKAFEGYFTNRKENFYVDIPLFFGPHNWSNHLIEKVVVDNLEEDEWHQKIFLDVKRAREEGQPILLFALSEERLNTIKERLDKNLKDCGVHVSPDNWVKITDEEELHSNEGKIGERFMITLATAICGRGIDINPSKAIESGLHVLITELPENHNARLLIQMKGRTARKGNKGSFSIVVKSDFTEFLRISEAKMDAKIVDGTLELNDRKFELSKRFSLRLSANETNTLRHQTLVKQWLLFLNIISAHKINLRTDDMYEKAKIFIEHL